jgi:hypothetical protein
MNRTEYLWAEVDVLRREVQCLRADLATARGLLDTLMKERAEERAGRAASAPAVTFTREEMP